MTAGDNLLAEPVVLPAPPSLPPRTRQPAISAALPAVGSLGAIGFLAFAPRSPFIYAAGGLIVLVSIAMVTGSISRARRERQDGAAALRRRFLAEIDEARATLALRHSQVRRARYGAVISGEQLQVALATERVELTVTFSDVEDADPFCRRRASRLAERGARIDDVPVPVALGGSSTISGAPTDVAALVRQLLRAVITDLSPQQLRIAVLSTRPHRWRALRWAPQHHHPRLADASGPARLVAQDAGDLAELLTGLDVPLLLIVDAGISCPPDLQRQARWVVHLDSADGHADLHLAPDGSLTMRSTPRGWALLCSSAQLEAAARAAARGALPTAQPAGAGGAVDEPLRPLLGTAPDGGAVHLDLREAGRGGAGPHGLLIGVTGAGKSEVLRTIVAGLVRVHGTDELSLLLVDFKGGATFTPFEALPQVSATITNLEADPALVSRMSAALGAELRARQAALKQVGAASIDELRRPLPRLLVIIDEFSELLSAHPEALDVLVQIGRLGRSLGVHLLVAAQRLDEGRIKGLDTHLTYRIALRTASGAESRSVIGVPDAAELTNAPGHGYLRCGSADPQQFRARYTGAPHSSHPPASTPAPTPVELRYRNGPLLEVARADQRTVLDAALQVAAGRAGVRRTIWVPPPQHSPTHDELYADLASRPGRGYGTLHGPALYGVLGWADRPEQQRIEAAGLDLTAGHAAIIGTTRSGVTTTAVALGLSLALRSTPEELHLYLIEASSGRLGALGALPHCAGHATAGQARRLEQILQRVRAVIDEREQTPADDVPAVVLVIDGYAQLAQQHEMFEAAVLQIATRGLAAGVHLVLTGHSWLDLRSRLRDLLAERVELRLGDATESQIDRRAAAMLPRGRPGRGLTQQGHQLYAAQPADAEVIERICSAWHGAPAPGLVELPPMITARNLSAQVRSAGLAIGVDTATGRAHPLDEDMPLLLIIGDPGSGRTSIVRSLGLQDAQRGTKLLVIDPRRRLLGDLPAESLLGYAATPSAATELISGLVDGLTRRMPPADITPEQLHERGWWSGPRLHLIVDDYDLLALIGATLGPLRGFLPYAADIGLRVTIARRSAGAAAALHDETLSVIRDLGASGLLLSRSVDEGPVLGVRPGPAPWATGQLVRPAGAPAQLQAIVEPQPRRSAPA